MKKLKLNIQRFSSTNKTTHYELSQYVGTDKPTYLVDYNQDMSKIDTGIYEAKAVADINSTNIGDLTQLTTTDKLSIVNAINEVNSESSSVGDLQNLTTTDKTNIVSAINEVNTKANTIGNTTNLTTTDKTSVVNAVNEVNAKANTIGSLSSLTTTNKTSVVVAINEVNGLTTTNTNNISTINGEITGIHDQLDHLKDYSSNEAIIGKWIDGKPLYRTIFDYGQLPNNGSVGKAHNIPIDTPVSAKGIVKTRTGTFNTWTIPSPNIFVDLSYTEVYIKTDTDRTNLDGLVIIEYTKTTDSPNI